MYFPDMSIAIGYSSILIYKARIFLTKQNVYLNIHYRYQKHCDTRSYVKIGQGYPFEKISFHALYMGI